MVELNHRVKPDSDVVITELEGKEAVLLNLATKMYYTLNETGLRIWQLLSSGGTLEEINERLQNEFDVTPEKAKGSVLNLIGELINEKLVKVVDE
ncbi:MAG: PqqD family protein [Deltaproteobacteria bacterium]|jgi:PHD/YefM family antitoxin component YafN of YafNO toxin-antitoxin module|nr:PqqD family protein [Deltaproteobacteria bacterium]